MDNKLNNMINDFFENTDAKDENELNKRLQDFIMQYNDGNIDYENTPLDDAYEILSKAERAKTKKQAIKLAKKAYETCDACFDAIIFQAELEEDSFKRDTMINEGLKHEKERLKKEKFFDKSNIGHFYGIFETRPYIRGLYFKALSLASFGKLTQAKETCKEILRLNKNDNTGARYILMAIYAMLENEKGILNLYNKYREDNLEMLFPLFALYYKLGDDKKANKYLKLIDENNSNFVKFFKGTLKLEKDIPEGYYSKGDASEVMMYVEQYFFLIMTMPNIEQYILKNIKSK